ncbi:MAG: GGDEF domain-containing protein [Candidatus Omnitrophica bacterium]|nr:GGDEF domain-containing protein [Candidatus Omnitrophota bacterium]
MLHIVPLFFLLILLSFLSDKLFKRILARENDLFEKLQAEYELLNKDSLQIKKQSAQFGDAAEKTLALYDVAKDICKSLDEDKVFAFFKERLARYIQIKDCRFLKEGADLSEVKGYDLVPLNMDKKPIGYLAAGGIREEDKEKFHILAEQFMLGIKRALLYKKVQELSITDGLTQIFSRRYFLERFQEEFSRSKKFNHFLSFLMVDIDHFKEFNDNYGHLVGDAILRDVARVIKENIRQIDFMGRYGGEELSLALAETDRRQAHFAAERIRKAIEARRFRVYDEDLSVTISIGISTFKNDVKDTSALIEKADKALYQAKETGRNKVCAA